MATHYPGTKLAITEYYFGGGDQISGDIAKPTCLASLVARAYSPRRSGRPLTRRAIDPVTTLAPTGMCSGAFDMFLNYDGRGSRFGDMGARARRATGAVLGVRESRYDEPARDRRHQQDDGRAAGDDRRRGARRVARAGVRTERGVTAAAPAGRSYKRERGVDYTMPARSITHVRRSAVTRSMRGDDNHDRSESFNFHSCQ